MARDTPKTERMTAEERAQIQALVRDAYKESGARTWAAFARQADVSEYSLAEWRSGRGTPSALNLLKLLRAVGWLRQPDEKLEDFALRLRDRAEALQRELASVTDLPEAKSQRPR